MLGRGCQFHVGDSPAQGRELPFLWEKGHLENGTIAEPLLSLVFSLPFISII